MICHKNQPTNPSLLVDLQVYILYRHRVVVYRFKLVVLPLLVHAKGSTEECCLWVLQQCPVSLVRLTLIVFVMGGNWPYSYCFVGCYLQDLFNVAHIILVLFLSSFFFIRLVSAHVVHPYSSIDTTAAWKKLRFILSVRSDFHMTDSLSIAIDAFVSRVSMSFSVDGTLLPR